MHGVRVSIYHRSLSLLHPSMCFPNQLMPSYIIHLSMCVTGGPWNWITYVDHLFLFARALGVYGTYRERPGGQLASPVR